MQGYFVQMLPQWIIEKKRDGKALSAEEIRWLIQGYVKDEIPDYQMAAFAMAVYFSGMSLDETAALTDAMMRSGSVIDTSAIRLPKVDKHSTGGIGDKVSLILAPLVACCGIAIPMISGRGLGTTGGTLDKLESISGFRVDLSEAEFLDVVQKCGVAMIGQTKDIAPADKKLYGLRDVTATVPSIPLIVSSIMCKKLAEGIDALVLDVKVGKGAFMKTLPEAEKLATWLVEVGKRMGKKVTAILTSMNEPLGRAVGNALEVKESIDVLQGNGPEDLIEITFALSREMLFLAGVSKSEKEAQALLNEKIKSGAALDKFKEMIRLQHGNPEVINNPSLFSKAKIQKEVIATQDGAISSVDAELIGKTAIVLGAGRVKVSDVVDPAVGVSDIRKTGELVKKGELLCVLHGQDNEKIKEAEKICLEAFSISLENKTVIAESRIIKKIT